MAERTLKITLVGDASSATKAFKETGEAGATLEGKLGGLSGAFGNIASTAAGFLAANFLSKAPGALIDMAKGAAEDEAATARLEQSLRNYANTLEGVAGNEEELGYAMQELMGDMDERIAKGQELAFTDDDVRDSMQSLLAATGDYAEAGKRQAAAMDLARGAGIPLATATKMLGKLNAENVEIFKKMGITLGENATEADALAAVQSKFGGQAQAYANSTAGQFERAKIAISEIQESIGAALLPVMAKIGTVLADNMPAIQAFVGELSEKLAARVVPVLEKVASALVAVGRWIWDNVIPAAQAFAETELAPKFEMLRDALEQIVPAVRDMGAELADKLQPALSATVGFLADHKEILAGVALTIAGVLVAAFVSWAVAAGAAAVSTLLALAPIIAVGAAVSLLIAGVILLVKHWDDLTAKLPGLAAAAEAVKAAFGAAVEGLKAVFEGLVSAIQTGIEKIGPIIDASVGPAMAILTGGFEAAKIVVNAVFQQIANDINLIVGVVRGVVDIVAGILTGDWGRAWQGVKEIFSSVWGYVTDTLSNFGAVASGLGSIFLSAGSTLMGKFFDGMRSAAGMIAGVIGDIGTGIANGVIDVMNAAIGLINGAIPDKISIPGLPDIDLPDNPLPSIPRLARGGIVVAGDNASGIEAIVPLERAREFGFGGGGGGGGGVHFHFSGFVGDVDELVRQVDLRLKRAGRAGLLA